MLALQRRFELQDRGRSLEEAIHQADTDLISYRVPSEVMGSRIMSLILKSPYVVFGPYQYGRAHMLAEMVKDMIQGVDPARRWEAVGKLTILGGLGVAGYYGANKLLQYVTGNPQASVANVGPFGPLRAIGEKIVGTRDWGSLMSSLFDLAPILEVINQLDTGKDRWGEDLVPGSGPIDVPIEVGEAAASYIAPVQLALHALQKTDGWKRSLGSQFGLKLPEPGNAQAIAAAKNREAGIDLGRVRRDIIDQWVREWLHQPLPPAKPKGRPRGQSKLPVSVWWAEHHPGSQ